MTIRAGRAIASFLLMICLALTANADTTSEIGYRPPTVLTEKKGGQDYYNILSIDGGGIRGIIPSQVIDYLELALYKEARKQNLVEENETKRLHLTSFFDMFAGTSIGGIAAAMLAYPSDEDPTKPKYLSPAANDILAKNGPLIFNKVELNDALQFFIILIGGAIFGALGYFVVAKINTNKDFEEFTEQMEKHIREQEDNLHIDDRLSKTEGSQENGQPVNPVMLAMKRKMAMNVIENLQKAVEKDENLKDMSEHIDKNDVTNVLLIRSKFDHQKRQYARN